MKNIIDTIVMVLLIIGGLNWGLAIWSKDLGTFIDIQWLINSIYGLVAVAALYGIYMLFQE